MLKKLVAAALALLVAIPAAAEEKTIVSFPLAIDWDLDATSFRYPHSQTVPITTPGAGSRAEGVHGTGIKGNGKIQTSGASTTVVATSTQGPFDAIQVGDLINVTTVGNRVPDARNAVEGGQNLWLKVVTRTDANNITVNQTVDLTGGVSFFWRRSYDLATATGWIPVRDFNTAKFDVSLVGTTDGAGFNVRVECRNDTVGIDDASIYVVRPSYTAAAAVSECGPGAINAADQSCTFSDAVTAVLPRQSFRIDTRGWFECRVGVRINTADDAADAVVETIRVEFVGYHGPN